MAAKCWFSRKNLRNLLNMLFWLFFPLIFLTCLLFFSNAIKNLSRRLNPGLKSAFFLICFQCSADFPSCSFKISILQQSFLFLFVYFVILFFLSLLLSICFPGVFILIIFCFLFSVVFWIVFCFLFYSFFFSESAIPWAFKFTTIYCILFLYVGKMKLWN